MMNERIKELAEEANAWYPDGYPSGEGGDAAWQNLVIFDKEDLEKFAELIIRECASIARNANLEEVEGGDSAVLRAASEQIKEHFGVDK